MLPPSGEKQKIHHPFFVLRQILLGLNMIKTMSCLNKKPSQYKFILLKFLEEIYEGKIKSTNSAPESAGCCR